ncbi:MAG: hypothetical protein LBT96_04790 [Campylobacteraceae bacterium]|jgi:hypothetical protein|nr:hypothetical protein [Campylobacteraceae bacterium]
MQKFKQIMSWQFTALFFMMFAASNAYASQPLIGPRIYMKANEIKHVKIGETALVPVDIHYLPEIKSGVVTFEGNADFIEIGKVTLDASNRKFPYTVYVPITVIGEGIFDTQVCITIEA